MLSMGGSTTPKSIRPPEKHVIQTHFFWSSPNLHGCAEKRIPTGKFGASSEVLEVAKQEEIRQR
jgi:hypothetical protein